MHIVLVLVIGNSWFVDIDLLAKALNLELLSVLLLYRIKHMLWISWHCLEYLEYYVSCCWNDFDLVQINEWDGFKCNNMHRVSAPR